MRPHKIKRQTTNVAPIEQIAGNAEDDSALRDRGASERAAMQPWGELLLPAAVGPLPVACMTNLWLENELTLAAIN